MPYKNKPGAIALSLKELEDPLDIVKREQLLKELKEWENKDAGNVDSLLDLAHKKALINGEDANIDVNDLLGSSELPMPDYPSVDDLRIYEITNKYRPGYGKTDGVASLATDTSFVNQPSSVPEPSDDEPANVDYPQRDNSARRFELQRMIEGYDRDIAKLQAEIAMSEAGDPMYDLAVMRLLMDDDNSLLMDIRGRISKKIDQEFQERMKEKDQEFTASENEKNRQSTEKIAGMNKAEQDAEKKRERETAFNLAAQAYKWAREDLAAEPNDPKLKRALEKAKELYIEAANKAKKDIHFEVGNDEQTDLSDVFADYDVEGIEGLRAKLEDLKKTNLKAYERELRNLKARGVPERVLGFSGGEIAIASATNKATDALNTKIANATKLGPFDSKTAVEDAWNKLEKSVKDKTSWTYDKQKRKYVIIKKKVK